MPSPRGTIEFLLGESIMLVGALVPFHDPGGNPDTVRD
jgi:hypothetical protein